MSQGKSGKSLEDMFCSIERTLSVVGERWTLLILRESLLSETVKFADFEKLLGIAPNILGDRLNTLVAAGLMEKREYREDGLRARFSYHPTPKGEQLKLVLAALQQWGDDNMPPARGVTMARETADGQSPVRVQFVTEEGVVQDPESVRIIPTDAYPFDLRAKRLVDAAS
ncbi:helix-turn-helix domain-containing protein [Conyzicola nivalis]|uniref:HxlR family transcriptional regulator n=1 Tax=Conyzicola nivalis TaxID=1477021 RepID=A0A916WEE9_9MICO|nr:helix-turn-helix domain-containing protein [Conyzicola nivalis]GGA90786.1 HxlR family transcriptional regulator [Conyzicola nivalis]